MITRDNYEEYFLLYIDNELSVADREAVERFVAHHPDLQQDWKALLHCRLLPDEEIIFPDREALYGIGALEEEDNGNGFPIFSPDLSIVFPDKGSLYKQEEAEEDKRIVWLPWLRVGAAAAVVGVVALLVLVVKNNKIAPAVTPVASGTLHSIEGQATRAADDSGVAHPVIATRLTTDKPEKEKVKVKTNGQDVREEKEPVPQDLAQETAPHDAALAKTVDVNVTRVAVTTANVTTTKVTTTNVHSSDAVAALQAGIPREESSFATEALRENENHDPENNNLVADESPAPGKGKLRGLFRKVTRTFGKTADRDNDGQREVLIGAFQIALK